MTSKSAEPSEELRQLLRRIEELPTDDPASAQVAFRASRLGIDEPPPTLGMPLARADSEPTVRRQRPLAAPLLIGAVTIAAALTAAWSLRFEWPKVAGDGEPSGNGIASALAPPPARGNDTTAAPAGIGTPPLIEAGPVQEARAQPAPRGAPKPTLTVPNITAMAGRRLRVAIHIEPSTFSTRNFQLSVRGLPKGAQFVQGSHMAPDRWVIPASDLGALELALGSTTETGRFELACELRGADGKAIAEARSVLMVTAPSEHAPLATPTAPPPTPPIPGARFTPSETTAAIHNPAPAVNAAGTEPAPPLGDSDRLDDANQDKLLIQGLRLLVLGNINSARLLFTRAAASGNARAALILGDTFEDARLVQFGVLGVQPDRDKAVYWYERADELGAPEAKERLSDLNAR